MAKKKVARKKKQSTKVSSQPSFEVTLAALEKIVAELEGGDLGLAESIEKYEQAAQYLQTCQTQLDRAERKIEIVSGVDAAGNPITEPLGDAPNETRAGRRTSSKGRSSKADIDDAGRLF